MLINKQNIKALRRRHSRLMRVTFILLALVSVVVCVYHFFRNNDALSIRHVQISGDFKFVNENDFRTVVESRLVNQKLFNIKRSDVQKDLLNSFQGMSDLDLSIQFPDTVVIKIDERKPIATVVDETGERYLLDTEGYVLGIAEPVFYDLPSVTYAEKIYVGQFLDKNIVPVALEILKQAKNTRVEVTNLSFQPDFVTFNTQENVIVYVSPKKDIGLSFGVIAEVMKTSKDTEKKPLKIDLRYNKVIVLYE